MTNNLTDKKRIQGKRNEHFWYITVWEFLLLSAMNLVFAFQIDISIYITFAPWSLQHGQVFFMDRN